MIRALFLVSLLSLSGCSVVNTVRMMYANDEITPVWQQGSFQQSFEATYIGGKPHINLRINGEKLLFLIDTGASFSMLFDTDKAKKLAHNKGYEIAIAGWGEGKNTEAYQTNIKQVSLGKVSFLNVKFAYIPLSGTSYYISKDEAIIDGVIGHDILNHFAWTFDSKNNLITASRSPVEFAANEQPLDFETSFRKISIPVSIEFNDTHSVEKEVILDTGSRHYIKMSEAFTSARNITFPSTITAADFGMSGKVEHTRASLKSLNIGENHLNQVKVNLIPGDDEDDWWVIGNAIMGQFETVIDYHNSKFLMRPYEGTEFHTLYNLAGLELRKLTSGNFIVRFVFPNFPVASESIAVGDEIESINGIKSYNLTEADWLKISSQPNPIVLCVLNKQCSTIPLNYIHGYSKAAS